MAEPRGAEPIACLGIAVPSEGDGHRSPRRLPLLVCDVAAEQRQQRGNVASDTVDSVAHSHRVPGRQISRRERQPWTLQP